MSKELSLSEENYLKAIYFLLKNNAYDLVPTTELAGRLNTKASSITDMVRKLDQKKLVMHRPYKGIKLTAEGERNAMKVIRKHRLWEVFLVEHLGFGWEEVHDVAEQLEHIQSDKLVDQLDAFLGHPAYDPHGDPIPDAHGTISNVYTEMMSDCEIGQEGTIGRIKDSSSDFLRLIEEKELRPNTRFRIISKEPYDGIMELERKNTRVTISKKVASNLYVKIDA
jgi:DtxR family Mn-dependent transcriptional regulator